MDAEDQQMAIAQLGQQPVWRRDVAAHQTMNELEGVLVVNRKV
jgi:hypothetical protein